MPFICKQCGNCCKYLEDAFNNTTHPEDVRRWKKEGRLDILSKIIFWTSDIGDFWFHRDGRSIGKCPWLKKKGNKYTCKINDTKPWHCKRFPLSKAHATACKCNGYKEMK